MRSDPRPDPQRPHPQERLPRRGTDRVEHIAAWLVGAAALVLLVVAVVSGVAVHGAEAEQALFETATRTRVTAVLLEDVQVVPGEHGASRTARAMAGWTDPDGTASTGQVTVRSTVRAGDKVEIWIDPAGQIAAPPARPANAVVAGGMAVLGVLLAGGTALATGWYVLRCVTGACNCRRWEREWAQVGPVWSRDLR